MTPCNHPFSLALQIQNRLVLPELPMIQLHSHSHMVQKHTEEGLPGPLLVDGSGSMPFPIILNEVHRARRKIDGRSGYSNAFDGYWNGLGLGRIEKVGPILWVDSDK